MVSKIVTFAGGCYSGKTTTLDAIAEVTDSLVLKENIRDYLTESISDTRAKPNKYFYLQIRIIIQKILSEWWCLSQLNKYEFILIDRSLADSLYYYFYEVNYDELTLINKVLHKVFGLIFIIFARINFFLIYDKVYVFRPLKFNGEDIYYRPNKLNNTKEFIEIFKFVERFSPKSKIELFNLSNTGELNIIFSLLGLRTYYY